LEFGSIKYQENVIKFHNCQKQVWVITRGTSRIIKRVSGVIVKEVSVNKLIQIYKERLENNLHEDQLENKLRDIERE
jgi:phosphoglucomutase